MFRGRFRALTHSELPAILPPCSVRPKSGRNSRSFARDRARRRIPAHGTSTGSVPNSERTARLCSASFHASLRHRNRKRASHGRTLRAVCRGLSFENDSKSGPPQDTRSCPVQEPQSPGNGLRRPPPPTVDPHPPSRSLPSDPAVRPSPDWARRRDSTFVSFEPSAFEIQCECGHRRRGASARVRWSLLALPFRLSGRSVIPCS